MNLLSLRILKEELKELEMQRELGKSYDFGRVFCLKQAISQLESISLKSDCTVCRYNRSQEELSELNEEEYIGAFDKCRTCTNYYTNNFEEK